MNLRVFSQLIVLYEINVLIYAEISENNSKNELNYKNTCGEIFQGEQISIQSPNYPENYPNNIVCHYQVRELQCTKYYKFKFLEFDIENVEDCSKDRFEIENQGALCGKTNATKIYFAHNGSIHFKFVSNNSTSARKRFNILITRIPCRSPVNEEASSPANVIENYTFSQQNYPRSCCLNLYTSRTFTLTSPNFPQSLDHSGECIYKIQKVSNKVCSLKLNFLYFWLGQTKSNNCSNGYLVLDGKYFCGCNFNLKISTNFDESGIKMLTFKSFESPSFDNNSKSGFVIEVVQEECSDNQNTLIQRSKRLVWPQEFGSAQIEKLNLLNEKTEVLHQNHQPDVSKTVYFFGEPQDDDVSIFTNSKYVDVNNFKSNIIEFEPTYCKNEPSFEFIQEHKKDIEHCGREQQSEKLFFFKKLFHSHADRNCLDLRYLRGYIQTPYYPLFYPKFSNVCYRFWKRPGYCWLKLYFSDFHIEDSFNCCKDFLEISNETRYCGNSLHQRTVTLDLRNTDSEELRFRTDGYYCSRGFYGLFEQIPCQHDNHTFRPNDDVPTTTTVDPFTTECNRNIQEIYFIIRVDRNFETCSIRINKTSEDVCKLNLFFDRFNLSCTNEIFVMNGKRYCGNLSGKQISLDFNEISSIEIIYRGTSEIFEGDYFQIRGEQVSTNCPETPPAQRLLMPPTTEMSPVLTFNINQQQYYGGKILVKMPRNQLKDICMILQPKSNQINIGALCSIFIDKHKASKCEQLKINYDVSKIAEPQIGEMELPNGRVTTVEQLQYQEIDCDNIL